MTDDLVKRLHQWGNFGYGHEASKTMHEAADRIEALEARNKLLEQSQAAQALAGLGVNVVAAHNSGLAALKAGCKEERLRAKKAEARIEKLEAALRVAAGYISTKEGHTDQHPQDVYDWIVRAALAGEKKE